MSANRAGTKTYPKTLDSLGEDLKKLGVKPGTVLTVHSSLSSIGWVVGGPSTVVRSLLEALGSAGTAVMPAATPLCADPASWSSPRIPDEWLDEVREHLPVFDVETTPSSMGAIPETFRNWPGTLRSHHPLESICAHGAMAEMITSTHPLAFSEGHEGPFGRLFELDSRVLLIGVGFNRCTALHYAESLSPKRRLADVRFPMLENARRVWVEVPNVADDLDTHFPVVGKRYIAAGRAVQGHIGDAESILVDMRDLVSFAAEYFNLVL